MKHSHILSAGIDPFFAFGHSKWGKYPTFSVNSAKSPSKSEMRSKCAPRNPFSIVKPLRIALTRSDNRPPFNHHVLSGAPISSPTLGSAPLA